MLRTSAIQRTAPDARPKPAKGPRTVKCRAKGCMHRMLPNPKAPWCSEDCSVTVALAAGAERRLKLARADRAATKARKKALMTRAEHLAEAQTAFNAWVRARDAALPCICCGKCEVSNTGAGGGWDAGHYLSRGSHPHLRFDERNVFRQRKGCNRPGGTSAAAFRLGVIKRIGLAAVEALECDQTPGKWTIEELQEIASIYKAKLKALKGQSCPT